MNNAKSLTTVFILLALFFILFSGCTRPENAQGNTQQKTTPQASIQQKTPTPKETVQQENNPIQETPAALQENKQALCSNGKYSTVKSKGPGGTLVKLDSQSVNVFISNGCNLNEIKDLTCLQYLSLPFCKVKDISALSNLKNLQYLDLYTDASDLSPLKNLTNLKSLSLGGHISDISPIKNLKSLRRLSLNSPDISDISQLKNLTNLESLDLRWTKVSDVSPLSTLKNLKTINIMDTNVSSDACNALKKKLSDCVIICNQ